MKVHSDSTKVVGFCQNCDHGEPRTVLLFKIGRYFTARLCPRCAKELQEALGTELASITAFSGSVGLVP